MVALTGETVEIDTSTSSNNQDLFQQALKNIAPKGTEVQTTQVVPEAVMREHTKVGGELSPVTVQTMSDSLASELEYIIALKNEGKTLDPWMNVLFNQATVASGKKEGDVLSYDDLYSVVNGALNSTDSAVSRVWEEIGDRVIKHQLARIEVYAQGELELTSPSDLPKYVARETQVQNVHNHGETAPPIYKGPKKGWWNRGRGWNNVANSDKFTRASWMLPIRKYIPHQFHNGLTPQFPDDAKVDFSRVLDGDDTHRAEVWMRMQPELRSGTGAPVGEYDMQRLGKRMVKMASAMSEVADRRHEGPLTQADDFIASRQKVDEHGALIPGQYETTGRGRQNVQLHIDGIKNPFPVDFAAMTPIEQLNILTGILDKQARKELQQIDREKFIAGPIGKHIAEATTELANSADPKRFEADITQHTQQLADLRKQQVSLTAFIAAESTVVADAKLIKDLTDQNKASKKQIDALQTNHNSYVRLTGEKQTSETDIETITQLEAQLKALRNQKGGKNPPKDIDAQILDAEGKLAGRGPVEIGNFKKEIIRLSGEIAQLQPQEDQFQEYHRMWTEEKQQLNKANYKKGRDESTKSAAQSALLKLYGLDETSKDAAMKARIEAFLKSTDSEKTALTENIALVEERKRALEAQAGKQDAGIAWRLNRLNTCKELLLDKDKYTKVEQRIEQGKVKMTFDPARAAETSFHSLAPQLKLAHKAMPGLPPAYLHAIYVFSGSQALEQTTDGEALFKKTSDLLTPGEFYQQMREFPGYSLRLQAVFGVARPEDLPDSIYDPRFSSDHAIMDEMLSLMDEEFLESLVDFSLHSAKEGYNSQADTEYAKSIAKVQRELDSGNVEIRIKNEEQLTIQAQVELSLDVVERVHGANIDLAAVADAHNFGHEVALRAAGKLKFVMDMRNVMMPADIAGALPHLVAAIDTIIPAVNARGVAIDRNIVAQEMALRLLYNPGTATDLERQADCIALMPERFRKISVINTLLSKSKIDTNGTVHVSTRLSLALKAEIETGLTQLVKNGYVLSKTVQEENKVPLASEAFGRYKFTQELVESMTRVFSQTPESQNELLVLSTILPSVEPSILKALSEELGLAISQRRQPDLNLVFGVQNGETIRNKFNQRLSEIIDIYHRNTGIALADISTLSYEDVIAYAGTATEIYGLKNEQSRVLLQKTVTAGERIVLVRFYDQTLSHLNGAELAQGIRADTGLPPNEAITVAHMILAKRKLQKGQGSSNVSTASQERDYVPNADELAVR